MATRSQDRVPPYLHGDNGYPFLSWLMTPHKKRNIIQFWNYCTTTNMKGGGQS